MDGIKNPLCVPVAEKIFILGGRNTYGENDKIYRIDCETDFTAEYHSDAEFLGRDPKYFPWRGRHYILSFVDRRCHKTTDFNTWEWVPFLFPNIDYRRIDILIHNDFIYIVASQLEKPTAIFKTGVYEDIGVGFEQLYVAEPFYPRSDYSILSFKDTLFLVGGWNVSLMNDVWCSPEGTHWMKYNTSDKKRFSPRSNFSITTFKDSLILVGGRGISGTRFSDTWRSTNGIEWECLANANIFSRRSDATLVENLGDLYLVGGENETSNTFDEIYRSPNGIHWTKLKQRKQDVFSGLAEI